MQLIESPAVNLGASGSLKSSTATCTLQGLQNGMPGGPGQSHLITGQFESAPGSPAGQCVLADRQAGCQSSIACL